MSNELKQAAEAVKNHGRVLRAVITLADEVEKIGNIDQAEAEAQKRLDATKANIDSVNVVLDVAKKQLADTDAAIDAAHAKAQEIIDAATADAAKIVSDANDEAKGIVDKANADAATIGTTIETKQSQSDELDGDIAEKKAQFAAAQKAFDELKSKAAAIAG